MGNQRLEWQKKTGNQLLLEVQALKQQLNRTRKKRNELEKKRNEIAKTSKLELYKEYIRGIIAEPKINTAELTNMERYKQQRRINGEDHMKTLKAYEDTNNDDDECVVCYEPPRDHMIMPCNHVCLCPDCADDNFPAPHDGQKCPLCSK